ncbi:MAG: hypothetical protein L6416_11005 [Candidatus Omnitrophica bacterium]|nr:hypothetical protein [Candidatus Omnitrophota bacterium]
MNKRIFFKTVSFVLIISFLSLDMSWAGGRIIPPSKNKNTLSPSLQIDSQEIKNSLKTHYFKLSAPTKIKINSGHINLQNYKRPKVLNISEFIKGISFLLISIGILSFILQKFMGRFTAEYISISLIVGISGAMMTILNEVSIAIFGREFTINLTSLPELDIEGVSNLAPKIKDRFLNMLYRLGLRNELNFKNPSPSGDFVILGSKTLNMDDETVKVYFVNSLNPMKSSFENGHAFITNPKERKIHVVLNVIAQEINCEIMPYLEKGEIRLPHNDRLALEFKNNPALLNNHKETIALIYSLLGREFEGMSREQVTQKIVNAAIKHKLTQLSFNLTGQKIEDKNLDLLLKIKDGTTPFLALKALLSNAILGEESNEIIKMLGKELSYPHSSATTYQDWLETSGILKIEHSELKKIAKEIYYQIRQKTEAQNSIPSETLGVKTLSSIPPLPPSLSMLAGNPQHSMLPFEQAI